MGDRCYCSVRFRCSADLQRLRRLAFGTGASSGRRERSETTTPPGFSTVIAKSVAFVIGSRASIGTSTSFSPAGMSNTPPSTGVASGAIGVEDPELILVLLRIVRCEAVELHHAALQLVGPNDLAAWHSWQSASSPLVQSSFDDGRRDLASSAASSSDRNSIAVDSLTEIRLAAERERRHGNRCSRHGPAEPIASRRFIGNAAFNRAGHDRRRSLCALRRQPYGRRRASAAAGAPAAFREPSHGRAGRGRAPPRSSAISSAGDVHRRPSVAKFAQFLRRSARTGPARRGVLRRRSWEEGPSAHAAPPFPESLPALARQQLAESHQPAAGVCLDGAERQLRAARRFQIASSLLRGRASAPAAARWKVPASFRGPAWRRRRLAAIRPGRESLAGSVVSSQAVVCGWRSRRRWRSIKPAAGDHRDERRLRGDRLVVPLGVSPDFDEDFLNGVLGVGVGRREAARDRPDQPAVAGEAVFHGAGSPAATRAITLLAEEDNGCLCDRKAAWPRGERETNSPRAGRFAIYFGMRTESMTWITPLEHSTSVFTTLASLIITSSSLTVTFTLPP